jgi:hypothetical protein
VWEGSGALQFEQMLEEVFRGERVWPLRLARTAGNMTWEPSVAIANMIGHGDVSLSVRADVKANISAA